MTDEERRAALEAIAAEVAVCTRCRLHETRTRAVPGEGNPDTEVMFVGEGPGFNEDRQGRPFVGQAGSLLTELLASIGWRRDEVFITNVVKCRPPGNRDPEPDEIAACSGFLGRQLAALDPALVVTLGRFSMAHFMPGARIGQVHGTFRPADEKSGAAGALAFAMYHPAAALHQGSLKETLFRDMTSVPAALLEARDRRATRPQAVDPEPQAAEPPIVEPEPLAVEPEPPAADPEPQAAEPELQATEPQAVEPAPAEVESQTIEPEPREALESEPLEPVGSATQPAHEAWRDEPSDEMRESRAQMTLF